MNDSVLKASDFDYDLPEEKIAKYPPEERGTTRLLVLNRETREIVHSKYAALAEYLSEGDLLILNDTRVIKARLLARKVTGAKIELLLLEKHAEPQQLVMYSGKLKFGHRLLVGEEEICVEEIFGNGVARVSSRVPLLELVEKHGSVPIPPYLKREPETTDEARYQTVFAREHGSVAAPTASLNFTEDLKAALIKKGVKIVSLTLHVGLGTFLPIRVESFAEHKMHREFYQIPKETVAAIQETKATGGRVIGLGTTVTRALEHVGKRILSTPPKAVSGEADIFIYPGGYQFQVIDGLLTNFHAPRSTVLMLTATFAGPDNLRKAYAEALRENYRFLSYGDSMLIL